MHALKLFFILLCVLIGTFNQAELLTSTETHFTAQHRVSVKQGATEAFNIFVNDVGDYWPSDHTWSGDARKSVV